MSQISRLGRRPAFVGAAFAGWSLLSAPFAAAVQRAPQAEPIAETTAGKVRGAVAEGICVFRGVPYGASTAGENRFLPPKQPVPWSGIRDALTNGPTPPQTPGDARGLMLDTMLSGNPTMSEDCLSLNVYTPRVNDGKKRPVMVWLHGGGWTSGAATAVAYDGTNLAKRGDLVVVGVNHRLNAFGFFYVGDLLGADYADSGNLGMLDIVAALQWVRDNIDRFGGDAKNVTIFGQSSGGSKVSILMAMPAAKGLFHKAIVQSGGGAFRQRTLDEAKQNAEEVLAKLNLTRQQATELRTIPFERLLDLRRPGQPSVRFGPVVDGRALPRNAFGPDAPAISVEVPMIIGTTETEATMAYKPDDPIFHMDEAEMRRRVRLAFAEGQNTFPGDDSVQAEQRRRRKEVVAQAVDPIIAQYMANRPNATPSDLFWIIATDIGSVQNPHTQAARKAAQAGAPVYVYEFVWRTKASGGVYRSPHTIDVPFVFDNTDKVPSAMGMDTAALKPVVDMMCDSWIAFARTGNPNAKNKARWPAFDLNTRALMVIDTKSRPADAKRLGELAAVRKIEQA